MKRVGILDVLRESFTTNMENMLDRGEVVPAVSRGTKNREARPLPCTVCNHPVAVAKGNNGKPLCAACLTLSAKMPCHSDPGKPEGKRGLSPCNPKGGGMGLVVTPNAAHFFVKEEKFDLVFLDTVNHTGIPFVTVDHILAASTEMAMGIPDGSPYWWGMLQENDIYPTLDLLRDAPWDIAQDVMLFRKGLGLAPRMDTRTSWLAITDVKRQPEYVRLLKMVKRIVVTETDEEKRQAKLAALNWQDYPECQRLISGINEHALMASF